MTTPSARRLIIAERFRSPDAELRAVVLPLDVAARAEARRWRFVVQSSGDPAQWRSGAALARGLRQQDSLRVVFEPFPAAAGREFLLGVFDLTGGGEPSVDRDRRALREAASGRPFIGLECACGAAPGGGRSLVFDECGLAVLRDESASGSPVRLTHWIDAYWRDAYGIYLRGWAHAHEHRVRALRLESGGRSVRVSAFTERADLLAHYPAHDHVRRSGFAAYLACAAGHPVRLTVETDGGEAACSLELPDGPLPAWPKAAGGLDGCTPMWQRFAALANAGGGLVLQIGARTIAAADDGRPAWNASSLLDGGAIGFDIHPGPGVALVGDAHVLSRCVRAGSLGGVFSNAVLEHLQAPWLVAAEANRALKPGGLTYHQVPAAWPAHAQPNDFWRFSDEGLRALFGAETGFEVLDVGLLGPAAILPAPEWRRDFLDMPTVPAYAGAEILARKVRDLDPGAVAWPLDQRASEARSRRYPVEALRPPSSAA